MYSILDTKNNEKSTHKGHNSYIKYGEFRDTLVNEKVLRHKTALIHYHIDISTYLNNKNIFLFSEYIRNI